MQKPQRSLLLAIYVGAALIAGCQREQADTPQPLREDVIPLVRPLPTGPMSQPMVVEFEVPPPPKGATSTLVLGLRVTGHDSAEAGRRSQMVIHAGAEATLKLHRVDSANLQAVLLLRDQDTGDGQSQLVALGGDGRIGAPWPSSLMDNPVPEEDGTIEQARFRYLSMAWAKEVLPGRYRLSLQMNNQPHDFVAAEPVLIVAYHQKSK